MRRPETDHSAAHAAVLDRVAEQHRVAALAQAAELEAVVGWADLHQLSAALDGPVSHPGPHGTEGVLFLAGPGARGLSEFAVCQLAVTLGLSERAARSYLGQAVELRDRLPRLYAKTIAGVLPVWRARDIAEQTRTCSPEVAAFVDAHLAGFAHKINTSRVTRCVQAALLHCDPETARARADAAAEQRRVEVIDHLDGISTLTAVLHTPDAAGLEHRVTVVAEWLAVLGDLDPLDVRRARALTLLADPQAALAFEDRCHAHTRGTTSDTVAEPKAEKPTFHLHLHTTAEAALASLSPVVRVEGAGRRLPVPLAAVEQWLTDLAPDTVLKLTPVIDLTDRTAVDAYETPPRLAAQVDQRDHTCVFPWCGRRGRYDLDHITEYIPPDNGGPPAQTSPANLARLCRFHHRVKTHAPWHYRREPDDSLTWQSPTGHHFRVDHTGTARI